MTQPVTVGINPTRSSVSYEIPSSLLHQGDMRFLVESISQNEDKAIFQIKVGDSVVAEHRSKPFPKDALIVKKEKVKNGCYVVKLKNVKKLDLNSFFT